MTRMGMAAVVGLVVLMVAGGLLITSGSSVLASEDDTMVVPMGDITLEPPEGVDAKKTPVDFPHSTHFNFNCKSCHHTWEPPEKIISCTTSGCHDVSKLPEKKEKMADADLSVKYYRTAFHNLCIGCHKTIKTKDWKMEMSGRIIEGKLARTGPTGCIQCHPREE